MRKAPVEELEAGGRLFDVFERRAGIYPEIVEKKLIPPLPVWNGRLVWGFSLLETAAGQGLDTVAVEDQTGDMVDMIRIALELENRCDAYAYAEKAAIASLLARSEDGRIDGEPWGESPGESAVQSPGVESTKIAGIEPLVQSKGSFAAQSRVYCRLSEPARKLVDAGRIDLRTADRYDSLPSRVWELLESTPSLSAGRMRNVAQLLWEIAMRDRMDAKRTIEIARTVLPDRDPETRLRIMRYPELEGMYERFERLKTEVLSGTGVHLEPPDYFEGDSYRITFAFATREELSRRIRAVESVEEVCDRLLELL